MEILYLLLLLVVGESRPTPVAFERATGEERAAASREVHQARAAAPEARLKRKNGRFGLLVTLGEQRTGGYSIQVRNMALQGATLEVTADVRRPSKGDIVTQALTYPFDFVWIPAEVIDRAPKQLSVHVQDQDGKLLVPAKSNK